MRDLQWTANNQLNRTGHCKNIFMTRFFKRKKKDRLWIYLNFLVSSLTVGWERKVSNPITVNFEKQIPNLLYGYIHLNLNQCVATYFLTTTEKLNINSVFDIIATIFTHGPKRSPAWGVLKRRMNTLFYAKQHRSENCCKRPTVTIFPSIDF